MSGSVFNAFVEELRQRGLARTTMVNYEWCIKHYEEWLGRGRPTEATFAGFLTQLREKVKPATVVLHYQVLHQFHEFLGHPVRRFRIRVKQPKILPPFHDQDEIKSILNQITPEVTFDPQLRLRDHTIIYIFALAGLRLGELHGLRRCDIDLKQGYIRAFGKGAKERAIPISIELQPVLEQYLSSVKLKPDDHLFSCGRANIQKIVRKYARLAGLDIHCHTLRHFFASQLAHQGQELRAVQELLGHASPATTAIYEQVAPRRLKKVINMVKLSGDLATEEEEMVLFHKAWQRLLKEIEAKATWDKNELKELMLKCLLEEEDEK